MIRWVMIFTQRLQGVIFEDYDLLYEAWNMGRVTERNGHM